MTLTRRMYLLKRLVSSVPVERAPVGPPLRIVDILGMNQGRVKPSLPPPTPPDKMRIHMFAGDFASQKAAWHYCFFSNGDQPEEIVRHLPDAPIDTAHVEVRYREAATRLGEFLLPTEAEKVVAKMEQANTLVIIAEPAFGGLAYALNDTPRLRYLGPLVVSV